jgi:taurine dioxygenase
MHVKIVDDSWPVIIEDIDLRLATADDMRFIGNLISKHLVVVIPNQKLTIQDEIRICEMIGNIEDYSRYAQSMTHIEDLIVPNSNYKLTRVTGAKNERGKRGAFGHQSELSWHADQSANSWRCPIVYLYGITGTEGSRTSWINNILSYNDLPDALKEEIKDLKIVNGYKKGAYSEDHWGKEVDINFTYTPNLVYTNRSGQTGLFFPFLQIHQIVGMNDEESLDIVSTLRKHVEQEKYMYHHDWSNGDIVFHEQWLSLHKRWYCENIEGRLLHRASLDFAHCDEYYKT